jgi:hypothetical protein
MKQMNKFKCVIENAENGLVMTFDNLYNTNDTKPIKSHQVIVAGDVKQAVVMLEDFYKYFKEWE